MEHPHPEKHYVHRSNWLRAAVLGANDGLLSTAALVVGVASSGASQSQVLISGIAGLVAGAFSMAAGEYVSVSSQADIERADLAREAKGLAERPETELSELAHMFMERGVNKETAFEVAHQMHEHDALNAHAREELGISDFSQPRPFEAAFASAASFALGAILPILVVLFAKAEHLTIIVTLWTLAGLASLGYLGASAGGAKPYRAMARVVFWGAFTLFMTFLIGDWVGASGL